MSIFVAYAGKHGATQGIVEMLRAAGQEVEARSVKATSLIERIKTSATRSGSSVTTSRPSAADSRRLGRQPTEVASGVYYLEAGSRFAPSNVYFVQSGSSWVLIDTAWAKSGRLIKETAEALFGVNTRPAAILLTHLHPDHAGSALKLAQMWDLPVYMHPDEMPLAAGTLCALEAYPAGPLDRWVILPLMRAMPRRRLAAMLAKGSLKERARPFDPRAGVPGLPDWECIPTPGHSPGHVSFFRPSDRVLITGDAVVTMKVNSVWGSCFTSKDSRDRPGTRPRAGEQHRSPLPRSHGSNRTCWQLATAAP